MPGYDGTGPNGTGPNGRGLGPCGDGRGFFGFRRGRRGGRRGFWSAGPVYTNEKDALEAEKGWLKRQLDAITSRLGEIDSD